MLLSSLFPFETCIKIQGNQYTLEQKNLILMQMTRIAKCIDSFLNHLLKRKKNIMKKN